MRTRTRTRTLFLLVVATALVAFGAATASAAPGAGAPLKWRDCGDGFRCATVRVPLDYDAPQDGTIALSVIKKPHTGRGKAAGTVFTNPGGPGGSGVDFLRAAAGIFAGVNDRFDIVSWDPRGTTGSEPVDCLTDAQRDARWPITPAFPTIAQFGVVDFLADQLIAGCLAAEGAGNLPTFTTENAARDLDQLRAAVGDAQLTYLGFSYGTYLGATYAALFPDRARALVLDGALDPTAYTTTPLENLKEQSVGFDVALNRFFTWCDSSPICGFEGGRAAFDELIAGAASRPLPATASGDPRPVLQQDVQNAAVLPMYARQLWPLLGDALTLAQQAGDGSLLLLISDAARGRGDDGGYGSGADAFVQTSCVDLDYPTAPEAFEAVGQQAAQEAPLFGLANNWTEAGPGWVCGEWPLEPTARFAGPFTFPTPGAPALVVGTTFDPATPYAGALALTAQLGKAELLTMDGDGHTAYGGNSPCIDGAVDAYLETLALPPAGTVCTQVVEDPQPEETPAAQGTVRAARVHAARGLSRQEVRLIDRVSAFEG
jgi:pimeloyl-ACP methyl ester carboxylesterase